MDASDTGPAVAPQAPGFLARLLPRARRELAVILALMCVAGGGLGFITLADEVAEGETKRFDQAVMLALRTPGDLADPIGPYWLERSASDVTALGGYPVLALMTLGVIGFLLMARKAGAALLVLVSIGGGMLLSAGLKTLFARPRPDLVPHGVEVLTASFPSGHATLSAVTYLTLAALLARVQARQRVKTYLVLVALVLTLLIGSSRVYLGVHWPTDVLAGWCVGAAWAMGCWVAAVWLQRRGSVEPPTDT